MAMPTNAEFNNTINMKARKLITLLTITILSTFSLYSQSFLIPVDAVNNKYPITFTDAAQQKLVLYFTKNVTPGANISTVGWSVTGTAATITQIDAIGTNVLITLNTSITFAERNNVKVTYNALAGSFSMADLTEPNFLNISAVNNYIAVPADFSNGLYGENPPVDICAKVENVEVSYNVVVSHAYRNSIHYALPKAYITWQYPLDNPKTQPNMVESGGVGSGIYSITSLFAGYPDNTLNCTWVVGIYPYIFNSGTLQPNLFVTQNLVKITLPNYKKDNGTPVPGTGTLGLNPPVGDPSTLFCVGENITNFIFTDATVFDCRVAVESDLPNIRPRNVQFVYGTQTGAGIPNVFINVNGTPVQVTDNNGVSISGVWHVNPNGTPNIPGYTTPSGFFEGPVVQYLWDAFTKLMTTPMAQTYPISHIGDFVNDAVNDIFDVTLRNWGPCNAYDAFDPFTSLQAVTEFSRLRLVGAPPLPTASDVTVCLGGVTTLSAIRNGTNPGILHWYNNSDLLPIHEVGTGLTYNPGALAAGVYNYWVREIGTTGQFCEGPAKNVVLTIREGLTQPGVITGPAQVCVNQTGIIFSVVANPPLMPIGGATQYIWSVPGGWTITAGQGTRQITVTIGAATGVQTVSLVNQYTTVPTCPSPSRSTTTNVNPLPVPTITGPATACINVAGNLYTTEAGMSNYIWSVSAGGTITAGGGAANNTVTVTWTTTGAKTVSVNYTNVNGCVATSSTVYNITVNALPVPTIAGPATACINISGNVYTSQAGMSNYIWAVSAGGTITAGGGAGNNTVTVTWTTTGAKTVSVNYTNGNGCTATSPTVYNVTVNSLPVPTIAGPASKCVGSAGNVYTTQAGMSNYSWSVSAGGTITAGGGAANSTVTVTWTTSGAKTVSVNYTNGNGCTATSPTVYNVTVNPLPVPTITGPATACINVAGNLYTTEAGMSNYIWSVSAGGTITAGGGAANNTVTVTWTTTGAKTVSVNYTNVNGCVATSSTVYNITVNALPVPTIAGPATACINISGNVYTSQAGMSNYIWAVSAGGTITAGGGAGNNTVTVTWTTTGAKTVSVNYTNGNGCTATSPTVYNVTVNSLPVPTIAGPASKCVGSAGNVYTTQAGMSNYSWSVSAGGTITAGGGAANSTVTVTWTTSGAKTVSVNYTNGNGCTATSPTVYNVTVNPLPVPTIAGPCFCVY